MSLIEQAAKRLEQLRQAGVEIPEESDLSRARDVLDELYRRSGDRTRAPFELDYYRRLLDRF